MSYDRSMPGSEKTYSHVSKEQIESFLTRQQLVFKLRPSGYYAVKECPLCHKPHNNDLTNLWSLNIHGDTGGFRCFRCMNSGSWHTFVKEVYGDAINFERRDAAGSDVDAISELRLKSEKTAKVVEESVRMHQQLLDAITCLEELEASDSDTVAQPGLLSSLSTLQYLIGTDSNDQRHLSVETLKTYKIGIGEEMFRNEVGESTRVPVISYPLFRPTPKKGKSGMDLNAIDTIFHDCVRSKLRGVGKELKHYQRFKPTGGFVGIFGLNTLQPNSKIVVVTEGEFDAMAVHEVTGFPAVSLPNGASHLPAQLVGYLEKVERVYLWMDNDEAGLLNIENFANKLGVKRTFIVQTDPDVKDANDALRKDPSLVKKYIEDAKPLLSKNLVKFEDVRSAVKNRILNKDLNSGVKSTYYPWFNKYLKGFRKGEFTVFTGPTGSGKTTFLSQLSLDFASAGVPTLWCSFELKNEVLLSTMLNQYAGVDLAKEPNRFDFVADKFENVPMYFQTYFGSTHVDDVTTMIDYAIYTHDVGHVVIDNLQFMLSGQGRGMERFDMQDDVVAKLRKMATTHNVHITLVIHPRKGEDGADLTVSSIFGTAKSTQEADNVIILQQRDKYRVIDIKKNRHDGEIGKAALWFDRHSKRFEQATAREIELLSTGTPVEEILEKRSRQVNPEAVAYHTFEEQDDMRVPKLTHRPDSVVTDENLHRVLARKNTPREHRHYSKAFHRLDEIQSALSRNSREEPDPQDFANIITISLEQPHMAPISSTPAREREQPREEDTSTDPFEIHYEGNYGAVGKSFKPEGRETSKVESRQTDRLPLEGTNQSAPQEEADNIFEQPFNARVLQGFSSDEKVETLDDLTAGEVIFTYDQLIEGQAGYPKKQQSKARSSRTDGSIQYKRKSAKAENQPKNEK